MAGNSFVVRNAKELVSAFADPDVTEVIVSADCDVTEAAWSSAVRELPLLISRDLNIEGDRTLPNPPLIRLNFLKAKVKLAGGVTLSFRNVALHGGRTDNMLRAPGLDILAPTDSNSRSTLILGPPCIWIAVGCLPRDERQRNWDGLQRPPDYPGKQLVNVSVSQDGCKNDTSAPILERCWLDRGFVTDAVGVGQDSDNQAGLLAPNNITMIARNLTTFCQRVIDVACLEQFNPYYCLLSLVRETAGGATATSNGNSSPPRTASTSPPLSSPLGANPMAAAQSSPLLSPSSLHPGQLAGAVCGAVAGAIILLLAVLLATAMFRRRWQRWSTSRSSGGEAAAAAAAAASGSCFMKIKIDPCPDKTLNSTTDTGAPAVPASNHHHHQPPPQRQQRVRGDKASDEGDCNTNKPSRSSSCSSTKEDATVIMAAGATALYTGTSNNPCWLADTEVPITLLTPPRVGLDLNISLKDTPTKTSSSSCCDFSKAPPGPPALPAIMEAGPAAQGGGGLSGLDDSLTDPAPAAAAGHVECDDLDRRKARAADTGGLAIACRELESGTGGVTSSSEGNKISVAEVTMLPVVRGRGAFGRVVEGLYLGKRVAVKIMAADAEMLGHGHKLPSAAVLGAADAVSSNPGSNGACAAAGGAMRLKVEGQWDKLVASFLQEVQVLGRCSHPNVVRLLAACATPPRLCLVMELMEASLEHVIYSKTGNLINKTQPDGCTASRNDSSYNAALMPLPKVLHVAICICRALAYLHPTITHRDLKPANVLVNDPYSDKPVVKLSDFGLARLWSTVVATRHPDAGTPPYMAPECFNIYNDVITHKADIYSLGVLLWEMLSGQRPWAGVDPVRIGLMVTFYHQRLPLDCLPPSRCSTRLRALMSGCWDYDPQRRPAAAEVANELTSILAVLEAETDPLHKLDDGKESGPTVVPAPKSADVITAFYTATSGPLSGSGSNRPDSSAEMDQPVPLQGGGDGGEGRSGGNGASLMVVDLANLSAAGKTQAKPVMAEHPGTRSPPFLASMGLSGDSGRGEGLWETEYR